MAAPGTRAAGRSATTTVVESDRTRGVLSDVRVDCPGHLNGFATDVTLVAEDARPDDRGL